MPREPRSTEELLEDVLRYGRKAEQLIAGKTYLNYANDERLRLALERCLIVIGEALSRAVQQRSDLLLHIGDIHRAVALRHRLVHAYYSLADDLVWSVLTDKLPIMMRQIDFVFTSILSTDEEEDDEQ